MFILVVDSEPEGRLWVFPAADILLSSSYFLILIHAVARVNDYLAYTIPLVSNLAVVMCCLMSCVYT